jgi:protein-tyrosine phosphatase
LEGVLQGLAERTSPDNVGPISRFALEALKSNAIEPEGAKRFPVSCSLIDFDGVVLVIALKEAEHRTMVERRFPEVASKVTYWHIDDIDLSQPADALARIDQHVHQLIMSLDVCAKKDEARLRGNAAHSS